MAEGLSVVRDGRYVCIEGPQISTLAESLTYKNLGYAVIGMTNMPEAKLAARRRFATSPWPWSPISTAGTPTMMQ